MLAFPGLTKAESLTVSTVEGTLCKYGSLRSGQLNIFCSHCSGRLLLDEPGSPGPIRGAHLTGSYLCVFPDSPDYRTPGQQISYIWGVLFPRLPITADNIDFFIFVIQWFHLGLGLGGEINDADLGTYSAAKR